jgi:hypothetical protein
VRACAIVVPTLGEVRTGPRDRERLAAYFDRLRQGSERRIVWVPGGLWEPAEALTAAREMGVGFGYDPLEAPAAASGYLRVRGIGARARLGESALSTVAEAALASGEEETLVTIESERSFREAVRLRALIESA